MSHATFETFPRWLRVASAIALVMGAATGQARASESSVPVARTDVAKPRVEVAADESVEAMASTLPQNAPVSPAPAAEGSSGGGAFGIHFDSDSPVSIRSNSLESAKRNGSRKLLFTQNVIVEQDNVTIRSQRLEAYYPPKASQPSRMVATGQVWISNGDYVARCDEAIYEREQDTLTCRGNAEMWDGDDCVAGEWIFFDLSAETLKVGGGARVLLGGDKDHAGSGGCA